MKPTRLLAAARLVPTAALLLLTAACATRDSDGEVLPAGRWVADITHDESAPPVPLLLEVGDGPTVRVLDPGYFGFEDAPPAAVGRAGDTIRFRLATSEEGRQCALRPDRDGGLAGPCAGGGGAPWTLRMSPLHRTTARYGLSAWLLERSGQSWSSLGGRRVRVHVPRESRGVDLAAVARRADSAVASNLAWLGADAYERPLELFLVSDRDEMQRRTGHRPGGYADAFGTATIATQYGGQGTVVQHEIMHVMSHNLWGGVHPPGDWLREAVATAAPGRCGGADLQTWGARLQLDGALVPLERLRHEFRRLDDVTAHLQAGALIEYLRERHGAEALEALWRRGPAGLEEQAGVTLEQVERAWRASLTEHIAAAAAVRVDALRGVGCG